MMMLRKKKPKNMVNSEPRMRLKTSKEEKNQRKLEWYPISICRNQPQLKLNLRELMSQLQLHHHTERTTHHKKRVFGTSQKVKSKPFESIKRSSLLTQS
jgi:hypothetical protein